MKPRKGTRSRAFTFPHAKNTRADEIAQAMQSLTKVEIKDLLLKGRTPPALKQSRFVKCLQGIEHACNGWENNTNNLSTGFGDEWLKFDSWQDLESGCKVITRCLAEEKANYTPKLSIVEAKHVGVVKSFMPIWLRFLRTYGTDWPQQERKVFRHFFATHLMLRAKF
jgi:hypothetical protein